MWGTGWMGVDTAAIFARNAELVEAQKKAAAEARETNLVKCELCGRTDTDTWRMNGPFPYNLCVDVDPCDDYRKSISRPLMEM